MEFEFDPAKDVLNRAKHGISLRFAEWFDMESAILKEDTRRQYNERRVIARGMIGDRVHVLVFTMRGNHMRVISLRKANRREVLEYVDETQNPHTD